MTYPETLYTALASAATGGAVFCALCVLAAVVFHRPCRKWRFSVFCILLSIAVVSVALLFIFSSFTIEYLKIKSVTVWCIAFCSGGIFCAAFYRVLIPVTISVYIFQLLFTYHIMRTRYPIRQSVVPVAVSRGMFEAGFIKEELFHERGGSVCIELDVCTLPPELLVPFPRTWYAFHKSSKGAAVLQKKKNLLCTILCKYASYVGGIVTVINIPVPSGADSAAMYTLDFSSVPPVLVCVL
jgi:hypothetical protein